MEAVKLKLLVPACCPNCGYDLRPDNTIWPIKLMHAQGTPDAAATIEGLFNYVVKPAEPPRVPKWPPRSKTPPRERRPPYGLPAAMQPSGRRTRRNGRDRSRDRKPKVEPVPPINPVQKRLLKMASETVGDVKIEPQVPASTKRIAADDRKTSDRGASEPPLPVVATVDDKPRPNPAMPRIKCSVPCNQISQSEVDQFLANFFEDNDVRKAASPKRPMPQIPQEAPRPTKLPWKGYRVLKPDNFVLQTGDAPVYDPLGGAAPSTEFMDAGPAVSVQVPIESGRVVAIHNHFYGETVVIPDSP